MTLADYLNAAGALAILSRLALPRPLALKIARARVAMAPVVASFGVLRGEIGGANDEEKAEGLALLLASECDGPHPMFTLAEFPAKIGADATYLTGDLLTALAPLLEDFNE